MSKKSSSKTSKSVVPNPVIATWKTPKKDSSKTPKPVLHNPKIVPKKPSSTLEKFGQEIEEIFSKKRKKPEQKTRKVGKNVTENSNKSNKNTIKDSKDDVSVSRKKKMRKSKGSNVDVFENEQATKARRKTGDGLALYTEDELGIGKTDAGGTRLCPFDCDCCF